MTSLIKLPQHPVKTATATATAELDFSGRDAPSSKLTLNINAFNGNKTTFGGKCNGNK